MLWKYGVFIVIAKQKYGWHFESIGITNLFDKEKNV